MLHTDTEVIHLTEKRKSVDKTESVISQVEEIKKEKVERLNLDINSQEEEVLESPPVEKLNLNLNH